MAGGGLFKMKFRVEQYERCETMNAGSIEDHLIGITKPSIDRMLKMENPADCIALYTFYCYTKKWQKNNAVFATSEFAMKALSWGRDKFSKAKTQLKEAGFIEDIQRKDSTGKIIGWFVGVRFAQSATLGNFHTTEIPDCGKSGDKYLKLINEIPNTNKQIQEESSAMASHSSVESTQPNLFPTNPSEANASGSAAAKLNSADGKETTPHCAAPPRNKKSSATQIEKPAGVSEQVWDDFIALRKAKRAPLSATALASIAKEAEKAAMHIEEALTECVTRGWQSFKADWMKPKTTTKSERFSNF
jgi:hypothetical protein